MKKIKNTIIITSVLLIILIIIAIFIPKNKKSNTTNPNPIPTAFKKQTTDISIKKKPKPIPKITSEISDKTIYLTFDDGPSFLTNNILDILNQEQIPATFFVTGQNIYKYKNTIQRAYNDGHKIALHTDTHNYSYIYSSDENYFNDLKNIKTKVYNITGENARIIRLPGGSSNTISKKYNDHIITRIVDKLNNSEYYYFDWNIDSGDAFGRPDANQIYNNTIQNLHTGTNIILMHDSATKHTTVEALPHIIKYGKEHGYTFAKITKNTPAIHHHINN